nr:flagellar motor rotation protein [Kaumoebavirus]
MSGKVREAEVIQSDLNSALVEKEAAVKMVESLKGQVSSKDADFKAASAALDSANAKITALEKELVSATASLTAQLREMQSESAAKDASIAKLEAQVAALQAQVAASSGDATTTEKQIADLQAKNQDLQTSIADLNSQISVLNTQKSALQAQTKTLQDQLTKIQFSTVDKTDYDTLKIQLATAVDKAAVLQSQLSSSQADTATLKNQLGVANAQIKTLQDQIATYQAASDAAQAQIKTLQAQIASNTSTQTDISKLQAQIATLQGQLDAANKDKTTAQSTISTLQTQVATATDTITTLRAENAKLQGRITRMVSIAGVVPKDYVLMKANNTMNCLSYDGTTLTLKPCAAVSAQLWHYDRVDGYIYNRNGQVLEALTGSDGVKVTTLAKSSVQMWTPVNNAFLMNEATGKYLGSKTDGTIVQMAQSSATSFGFTNKLDGTTPIIVPAIEIGGPITCPSDMDLKGGLCYSRCPLGWTSDGGLVCYKECPDNWNGDKSLTHCMKNRVYSAAKVPSACPTTAPFEYGGLCYQTCPSGSSNDFGQITSCRSNCPSGARQDPNTCYTSADIKTRSTTYSKSQPLVSQCPSGTYNTWGGCYPGCPWNYSMTSAGRCTENCPSGYRDDGTTCWRDTYWYDADIRSNIAPWDSCPSGYFRPTAGEWRCVRCYNGGSFDGSRCRVDADTKTKGVNWVTAKFPELVCPSTAPNKIGGLCYPNCPSGTTRENGNLEFCSTNCPSGYITEPLTCRKDAVITNRTVVKSLPVGATKVCAANQTQKGALCYDNCATGTQRLDADLEYCGSVCPTGYVDIGAGCQKPSQSLITKSVIEVGVCPDGQENRGGLCYIP